MQAYRVIRGLLRSVAVVGLLWFVLADGLYLGATYTLKATAQQIVRMEARATLAPIPNVIPASTPTPLPTPVPTPSPTPMPEAIPAPIPELTPLGEFTLTAYCSCVTCCEHWSAAHPTRAGTGYVQRTASGTVPTEGRTIVADTDLLPFGTKVVIGDKEYIVEDRGGAIKGNRIDIYFETHEEALLFGRQKADVYLKK